MLWRCPSRGLGRFIFRDAPFNDGALLFAQPLRDGGTIRQEGEEDKADDDGRKAFEQEQPLPAAQAVCAVHELQ